MFEKITILVCNGNSGAGKITWIAAQELVLEGAADWYEPDSPYPGPLLLVDGCGKKCLGGRFGDRNSGNRKHLVLADVGIEAEAPGDIVREDVELAKDAMVAEWAEVKSRGPALYDVCCCR